MTESTVERLQFRYAGRVKFEACLWEHLPMRASARFQEQIPRPSEFDIVVMILWSRIGTRLSADMRRPDGTTYASGTEFEFEDAVAAARERGLPHLLVFRKTARVLVEMRGNEEELLEIARQKKSVDQFIDRWFLAEDGSFKAAFTQFESADEFEDRLEKHLRQLVEEILAQNGGGSAADARLANRLWDKGSPFRGLQRFEYEDALIYFGRTKAIQQALEAIREQAAAGMPFLLVFGNSGVGKSSFARAGIVPFLTDPGVMEGVSQWRRVIFEPSDSTGDLLDGLAAALVTSDALPELLQAATEEELARILRESPAAAIPLLRRELAQLTPAANGEANGSASRNAPSARLLVVIDPLEEVFTRPGSTKEDRERFIAALHVLAGSGLVWVLSTMRSDFYERCGEHPQLLALKEGKGQYHLAPPTSVEISHMIRLPAQLAALQFESHPERGTLDDVLKEAAAVDPAALPLLQFTLDEIYKKSNAEQTGLLTFAAYDELGGMTGALRTRAEETIEEVRRELGNRTEATFSTVFSALVGLNPDADRTVVRLYAYLDRICAHPDCKLLVDALIAARLFITDIDDEKKPVVTICHEAMLKHWPRLAEWIDGNRDFLRTRARIALAADRWIEEQRHETFLLQEGKPLAEGLHLLERRGDLTNREVEFVEASQGAAKARRRKRRLRNQLVVSTLLVISVAAIGGWLYSIVLYHNAQQLAEDEKKANIEAQQQRKSATQRAHDAQKLVVFLLDDLRKTLAPDQKRDAEIIEKIAQKVREHCASLDPQRDTNDVKLEHAQNLLGVALIFEKMARFPDANELAVLARKLREEVLDPADPLIADCLQLEGLCQNQLGNYETAEEKYCTAIAFYEKSANPKSKAAGVAFGRQGEYCRQFGRYIEAEHWHQRGIAILEKEEGATAFDVGLRYNDLGELYRNWGKLDRAHECFKKALAIIGKEPLQDLRKLGDVKGNYGVLLSELGKHKEAEDMLRDALKTDRTAVGEQNSQVGADHYKLARALLAAKKESAAETELESSYAILKATVKPNHLRMAKYWEALAELKLAQGKFSDAEDAARKVLAIRKEKLSPPHPEIAKALDQLARVLAAAGRTADSAPILADAQAMQSEHARREQAAEQRIAMGLGG